MDFSDKILCGIVEGSTITVIMILFHWMLTLEMLRLDDTNAHSICRKNLKALARLKQLIHWFMSCVLLLAGHQLFFLINCPMLAWEVYETFSIKDDNEIFTPEEIKKQIDTYWYHLIFFFGVRFGIYPLLLI